MKEQSGQVIIVLLLVMVVTLAIGLSIVGRTTQEISTASKIENSSRAFSAAEAGIERTLRLNPALGTPDNSTPVAVNDLTNQSKADVSWQASLPKAREAMEYPPISKGSVAQFWFTDPTAISHGSSDNAICNRDIVCYSMNSFDLYFGDPKLDDLSYYTNHPDDAPAVEVTVVYWDHSKNKYSTENSRYFYDAYGVATGGNSRNNFTGCTKLSALEFITANGRTNRSFYCKTTVLFPSGGKTDYPVLARVRLLYSGISHQIAIKPSTSGCSSNNDCSLPYQVSIYTSTGTSGDVQRKLQVFRQKNYIPPMIDYALFSASSLRKGS